ncbi:MAG: hypothetical protein GEV12_17110 [Micromonosporaceae bacterium]|nr:hypothetical protein [Micromonosporaceae bacterium]
MTAQAAGAGSRLWQQVQLSGRKFRRWRRGRPFWGGGFLLLGGGQLFLSTQLSLLEVEISFGPEGFLVILLPAVLVLCGVLLWVTPQHRYFYSVIGVITAVYSLLGLNLGGWFIGMLLGVVGGALGFAWTAVPPPPDPATASDSDSDHPTEELPGESQYTGPLTDQAPDRTQRAPVWAPRPDPDRYAVLAAPLLLAAALVVPGPPAAPADHCMIPLPLLCRHDATPSPSPSATPTPAPSPTTGPGPAPTGPPAPSPTLAPTPTPVPALDPPPGQPPVAANPARMTADRLTQENFRFEGITELPTATGTIEVLQFSFTRSTATNFALAPTHDGQTTLVTADPLVISGDVSFYTSRFVGRALGVLPLELTPESPLVDLLELVDIPLPVFFTEVDLDLVFVNGAELTAAGFSLTLP